MQDMQLENGPPGYQVRVSAVTVRGPAELSGADLGVRAELTLGGEEAGVSPTLPPCRNEGAQRDDIRGRTRRELTRAKSGEETLLAEDILSNGTFVGSVRTEPEIWSTCVGEDGVVPLIRLRTTISLAGDGDATGTVGREDAGLEEAVSVHFKAIWRECE